MLLGYRMHGNRSSVQSQRFELMILVGHESSSDEALEESPRRIVSAKMEGGLGAPVLGLTGLFDVGRDGRRFRKRGVGGSICERVGGGG